MIMWSPSESVSRVSKPNFLGKVCYILFLIQSGNQPVGKKWSLAAYLTLMGGLGHDVSNFPVQYKRKESFWTRQFILLFSVHAQWCAGDLRILCWLENANKFLPWLLWTFPSMTSRLAFPADQTIISSRLHFSPCKRALVLLGFS